MPGIERRRHKRVECSLPIQLYVSGHAKPIPAEVKNISISGAFVQASEKIPTGEKVLLEFKESQLDMIHARIAGDKPPALEAPTGMSDGAAALYLKRVQGTGIGVEFLNVRPEVQAFLGELIEALDKKPAKI